MADTSSSEGTAILDRVSDLGPSELAAWDISEWLEAITSAVSRLPRDLPAETWSSVALEPKVSLRDEALWRKQVAAAWAADWLCYTRAPDRVALSRLESVMRVFPRGFRTWWVERSEGWLPVGYAAWFPVSARNFAAVEGAPTEALGRRSVFTPIGEVDPHRNHVYVFNYSVAPTLRGTTLSRRLLATLAAELRALAAPRLAAVTVSSDGARVAERFGLVARARRPVEGTDSCLYTGEFCGTRLG